MYPYFNVFGLQIETYHIAILVGLVIALILFAKLCDRDGMDIKVTNFYLIAVASSVIVGFGFAALFQAVYDWIETGVFSLTSGLTFIGGLIGGAATFFIVFIIFKTPERQSVLKDICANALVAVAVAHCLGRIGCFLAGCCYGKPTDGIFGIKFPHLAQAVYPTQLFEAGFLLALFFVLLRFKKFAIYIYPIAYGAFRFLIEFIRGDNRGQFFITSLSPSQTQSILMILLGIGMIVYTVTKKRLKIDAR